MAPKFPGFAACIAIAACLTPAGLSAQTATSTESAGGAPVSCGEVAFDHVLEFQYEESRETGCVGWNDSTSTCLYRDNWDTGRGIDSVECEISGGKLKVSWFPYPGSNGKNPAAKLKATFRDVDVQSNCFRKMSWEWKENFGSSNGKGYPHGRSICP